MYKFYLLFLFFSFYCLCYGRPSAQEQTDSLLYYHEIIAKPKTSTEIGKAFVYFNKRIKENLEVGDTIASVQDLRRTAIGQFELGFLYESEATSVKALELLENSRENSVIREARLGIYNHLGLVYRKLNLHSKALSYYDHSLRLAQTLRDSVAIFNNISNVYRDKGDYLLAEKSLKNILRKNSSNNDRIITARALDNLGFVQSKLNNPEALTNMTLALEIRVEEQDVPGLYSSYYHLSVHFKDVGQQTKAQKYASQAYDIAKKMNSASYLKNILSLQIEFSEDPKALEYKKLVDSLEFANQMQENKYAVIKYNVEREQEKTREVELQKEHEEYLKYLYLIIGIVVLLSALFIFFLMQSRHRKERQLQVYKTENRLSKKIHDEFASDLAGLTNFMQNRLGVQDKDRTKILHNLDDLYLRARDISIETGIIELDNYSQSLRHLIMQYNADSISVLVNSLDAIHWGCIPDYKKIALFRSIQELLNNTSKHAKASQITIGFLKTDRLVKVKYTDNGIGFKKSTKNLNGLKNVETRMATIKGNFSFVSSINNGFIGNLSFRY